MKTKTILLVILLAIALASSFFVPETSKWFLIFAIIIGIIYVIRQKRNINSKIFGILKPWKDLSPKERLFRDLWFVSPFMLLIIWLDKQPLWAIVWAIALIQDTRLILKDREKSQIEEIES